MNTNTNLYEASQQWANRPADQRFESLQSMYDFSRGYAKTATEQTVPASALEVAPLNGGLTINSDAGPAALTHWAFGQLARRIGAPAAYLRELPATVAADCINHGLRVAGNDGAECKALIHSNGSTICRALTSEIYARIWNYEVIERLMGLDGGWRVPPARPAHSGQPGTRQATEADILSMRGGKGGLSVNVGDLIAPAGLYASDHDMFAFMVNEDVRIEDGSDGGLSRGFFVSNSEVGAGSLKVTRFLYRHVCGNHIVWDAKDVQTMRVFHIGQNDKNFGARLCAELTTYANESDAADRDRVAACRKLELGKDKDEVLDKLFGLRILPRKTLQAAYELCVDTERAASPRTAWGMVQGITSLSQRTDFADDRATMDAAAGKVLSLAIAT